jgi:hypothetical protein
LRFTIVKYHIGWFIEYLDLTKHIHSLLGFPTLIECEATWRSPQHEVVSLELKPKKDIENKNNLHLSLLTHSNVR